MRRKVLGQPGLCVLRDVVNRAGEQIGESRRHVRNGDFPQRPALRDLLRLAHSRDGPLLVRYPRINVRIETQRPKA